MGLFYRRPLCFFAFLLVAFSLLGFFVSVEIGLLLLLVLAVILLGVGVFYLWKKPKRRILFLTSLLSLGVAIFSLGYSLLSVGLPLKSAEGFVGERKVLAEILREEYRSEEYAIYSVRLLQIEEEKTNISATLECYSSEKLSSMDRILAEAEVSAPEERSRDGSLLRVSVAKDEPIYLQRASETLSWKNFLFSFSGIRMLSERCQRFLLETMRSSLGESTGGLSSAFFLGDRSALPTTVVRDFTRSGTSHLMAVSGLHFSILFGALELLLRAFCCPKKGRVAVMSLGSLAFLFLTGFSMSACRAAIMLYVLYLNFLLREENDSITSLFVSFAIIVLISPYAVVDLGLWMSFLATLGLLTLYPIVNEKLPRVSRKRKVLRLVWNGVREAIVLVIITVIATIFLLPILWMFFGEVSTVSLLVNPLISLPANAFLVLIPIWLLCSPIPILSEVIGACLKLLCSAILSMLSFFSRLPSATVSLNFTFCRVLVPLFAMAMIAVLFLRFRRKWILFLPPLAFVIAFSICFTVVQFSEREPSATYVSHSGGNEAILVMDGDEVALCDVSNGSPWLYWELTEKISQTTATEMESIVLTGYNERHPSSMSYLLQSEVVRTLYLPKPYDAESTEIATELWTIAHDAGSEIVVYEGGEVPLTENVSADIEILPSEKKAIAVTMGEGQGKISYATQEWLRISAEESISERLTQSKTLIVGGHGGSPSEHYGATIAERGSLERIIYPTEKSATYHRLRMGGVERAIVKKKKWSWEFPLP